MLKKLEVDNFKTLNKFTLELTPMTIIVGNNGVGKSTILQIISLLCRSVQEDFGTILSSRNWDVSDLRSKCRQKPESKLSVSAEFELDVAGERKNLRWMIVLQYVVQKNMLLPYFEEVRDLDDNRQLMVYSEKLTALAKDTDEIVTYPPLLIDSSALKVLVDEEKDKKCFPELVALKGFLLGVHSYDLLSPDQMRTSSRGKERHLLSSGRNLPTYIKNMTEDQKTQFFGKLRRLLGEQIGAVSTETKGKPGWTYINVEESYRNIKYKVSSRHLSDGMLRLLAFIGISEEDSRSMVMLDEIENGINSSYAEDLTDIFKNMSENGRQLVATTHSVVFLDFVDKDDIVFLYRNGQDGTTVARKLFKIPELEEKLEYMYPGEVLYNLDNRELVELCMQTMN